MQGITLLLVLASLLLGAMAGWMLRRSQQQAPVHPFPPEPEPQASSQSHVERQALEHELAQARRVIAGLKGARPAFLSTGPSKSPDDFSCIRGVDPLAQLMLNNLGIHRYNQLASLNHEDVAWVASRMEISPSRIEDEDWVGQAQSLAILHGQSMLS